MTWLKQSTSVDVGIGPFLDETDGKTAETALTITQPDIRLKKNNGNWAQKNAAQTLTHEENGWYEVTLDATDTNTLGILLVAVHEAGALPVWREFMVVPANVWDSYFGADLLQVDTREVGGTAQTAGDIMADTNDIQARLPAALVGGRMDASVGAMAANVVTAGAIADGAIDRATFAADTGLQTIRSNTAQAGAAGTITLDAAASAADDFYNDAIIFITGGTGVGQVRRIRDYVGATKVATIVPAWATNPDNTSTFAILPAASAWDETLADHLDSGSTGAALNAAGSAGDPWATALPGAYGAGTAGKIVGDNINATISSRSTLDAAGVRTAVGLAAANLDAQLSAIDDFVDTEVAAILAAVDTEVAAIKAKTDQLTFTVANQVDSNTLTVAANAIAAAAVAAAAAEKIADALIARNIAGGSNAGRLVRDALRAIRNRKAIAGGTLTIYQEDDATAAWTAAVTTTAGNPISEIDPA